VQHLQWHRFTVQRDQELADDPFFGALKDVINADGTMGRVRRSIVIGTVAEFTTRRLAMHALSERLRLLNTEGNGRRQWAY
jgi:hypothetical protein